MPPQDSVCAPKWALADYSPPGPFRTSTSATTTNNIPNQSERRQKNGLYAMMPPRETVNAPAHRVSNVATLASLAHPDHIPIASAATIAARKKTALPSLGRDGLYFDSYTDAFETVDLLLRESPEVIAEDDVAVVERDKRRHVKSIVDALLYDGYSVAPDSWKTDKGQVKPLDAAQKQDWDDWQLKSCGVVELQMEGTYADAAAEYRAWEIFNEIVKVHRIGSRFTGQSVDVRSTCAQRIELAVKYIRDYAIVRQKLLDGDSVFDFASCPRTYAEHTYRSRRNNKGRANATGVKGRCSAIANGAVTKRVMSRKDVAERKKKAEALKAGSGKQQTQSTNVTTNATRSLFLAGQNVASIPPAQQQGTAASAMQPASGLLQIEDEAGFSPIQQRRIAAPIMQPAAGLLQNNRDPPRPDTTQSHGFVFPDQTSSAINEVYRFNSDWANFENAPPLDWTEYDTRDGADGANPSSTGFAGNNAFQAFPEPQSMQSHSHHTELDTPARHTAAANNHYGGMSLPDVGSIWSFQAYGHES